MEMPAKTPAGRFKVAVVTILVMAVLAAAGALWLVYQHRRELGAVQADAAAARVELSRQGASVATELASDIARSLAAFVADDVSRLERERLAAALAEVVRGHRVLGVVVLDPDGGVIAATDQRYAGRTLDDPATRSALAATELTVQRNQRAPGELDVAAPLLADGQRIGTVRVFVSIEPFVATPAEPGS